MKRQNSRIFFLVITMAIMTFAFTPRVYGCFDPNFFYMPYPKPSVGETVTFNASTSTCDWNSTTQEYIPIVSYEWDFGDGTDGTGVTATHTYTEQGNYKVTLAITDEKGTNGTLSIEIEVGPNVDGDSDGFPWWIAVVLVAAGVGVALPVYFIKMRKPTK